MKIEWPPKFCPECQAILNEVTARLCPPGVSMVDHMQALGGWLDELRTRQHKALCDAVPFDEKAAEAWRKQDTDDYERWLRMKP